MEAHGNIEARRQALLRILAALVAMAGGGATMPRRLRNAVLRLLRPAESAARRLVIALAKAVQVTLTLRTRKPKHFRKRRHFEPVMPPEPAAPRLPVAAALPLLDPARRFDVRRAPRRNSVPRISFSGERQPIPPRPCRATRSTPRA